LVPYATTSKWGSLSSAGQRTLLDATKDALARLLRESKLELLVLNGRSVVREFEQLTEVELDCSSMEEWALPRSTGLPVRGYAYFGYVDYIAGIDLGRRVTVVGYNHNLQSSYGVTSAVISSIGSWLAETISGAGIDATWRQDGGKAPRKESSCV
jgi:hypothetical protein